MAAVYMLCPSTGATVATGQHVTKDEFEARAFLQGRFRCSACQQVHTWTKTQVTLAEVPGATSRLG